MCTCPALFEWSNIVCADSGDLGVIGGENIKNNSKRTLEQHCRKQLKRVISAITSPLSGRLPEIPAFDATFRGAFAELQERCRGTRCERENQELVVTC